MRFKCMYCGQQIAVDDDMQGKKCRCLKCSHILRIPKINPDNTTADNKTNDVHITDYTHAKNVWESYSYLPSPQEVTPGWLVPTYDELTLFTMSLSLIILCVVNSEIRDEILSPLIENMTPSLTGVLLLLYIVLGMGLSLYNGFTEKKMAEWHKAPMLLFAVLANMVTCFKVALYLSRGDNLSGWQAIFAVWNFINAVLLFLMFKFDIIDENCIVERNISLFRIKIALANIIIIILFANFVLHSYWAVTFSICLVYITSFDRAIQNSILDHMSTKKERIRQT